MAKFNPFVVRIYEDSEFRDCCSNVKMECDQSIILDESNIIDEDSLEDCLVVKRNDYHIPIHLKSVCLHTNLRVLGVLCGEETDNSDKDYYKLLLENDLFLWGHWINEMGDFFQKYPREIDDIFNCFEKELRDYEFDSRLMELFNKFEDATPSEFRELLALCLRFPNIFNSHDRVGFNFVLNISSFLCGLNSSILENILLFVNEHLDKIKLCDTDHKVFPEPMLYGLEDQSWDNFKLLLNYMFENVELSKSMIGISKILKIAVRKVVDYKGFMQGFGKRYDSVAYKMLESIGDTSKYVNYWEVYNEPIVDFFMEIDDLSLLVDEVLIHLTDNEDYRFHFRDLEGDGPNEIYCREKIAFQISSVIVSILISFDVNPVKDKQIDDIETLITYYTEEADNIMCKQLGNVIVALLSLYDGDIDNKVLSLINDIENSESNNLTYFVVKLLEDKEFLNRNNVSGKKYNSYSELLDCLLMKDELTVYEQGVVDAFNNFIFGGALYSVFNSDYSEEIWMLDETILGAFPVEEVAHFLLLENPS